MGLRLDVAVIGGDARFAYLTQMLRGRGIDARAVGLERADVPGIVHASPGELREAEYLVMNAPVQMKLSELELGMTDVIRLAGPGAKLIFAGPQRAPALDEELFSTYDLSGDEDFLAKNAELTAEGAICAAMGRSVDAMMDARCLVIGWGRIGRALTERLVGLGARTVVASRSARSRGQAQARGAMAVDTAELSHALGGTQVIFSTAPAMVLDESLLARTERGTIIIDLASPPYGVDVEAARRLEREAWREPGVPGRYCPRSAARVLTSCVLEILKRKGGGVNG